MKYKLYYIGENGCNVDKNGEHCIRGTENYNFYEEWKTIEEAKKSAAPFLKANPLMYCVLFPGENGEEELVLVGDEESFNKAQSERENELDVAWKNKRKKDIYFRLILGAVFVVIIFFIFR